MFNVSFGFNSQKQNTSKPETSGTIANNNTPSLFRPAETTGSIASSGAASSGGSSSGCSCGSTVAIA